jgi:hypothetical protein
VAKEEVHEGLLQLDLLDEGTVPALRVQIHNYTFGKKHTNSPTSPKRTSLSLRDKPHLSKITVNLINMSRNVRPRVGG